MRRFPRYAYVQRWAKSSGDAVIGDHKKPVPTMIRTAGAGGGPPPPQHDPPVSSEGRASPAPTETGTAAPQGKTAPTGANTRGEDPRNTSTISHCQVICVICGFYLFGRTGRGLRLHRFFETALEKRLGRRRRRGVGGRRRVERLRPFAIDLVDFRKGRDGLRRNAEEKRLAADSHERQTTARPEYLGGDHANHVPIPRTMCASHPRAACDPCGQKNKTQHDHQGACGMVNHFRDGNGCRSGIVFGLRGSGSLFVTRPPIVLLGGRSRRRRSRFGLGRDAAGPKTDKQRCHDEAAADGANAGRFGKVEHGRPYPSC
jgi:hypothetical protein